MTALGHDRFFLVGHDRGGYVALRLALDHPDRVDRLALLDCIPISEHLDRVDATFASRWWHWFFYAQPALPEQAIGADPEAWYRADAAAMDRRTTTSGARPSTTRWSSAACSRTTAPG